MSAKALLEKYETEINKHDFNLVQPMISADCKFWFTSGTHEGLEEARQAFQKTWGLIKEETYWLTDIEWLAESEAAAVCVYTYHWRGTINGQLGEGKGRGTSCFRKEADGWKIVHEHLSRFPE